MNARLLISLLSVLAAAALAGCGGYRLPGRVVKGDLSMVVFVPPDDPALQTGEPVPRARVALYRDPEQLNRSLAGSAVSGPDGRFVIDVGEFGAGWMEEQWEIVAEAGGHIRAESMAPLPASGSDRVMLVIMAEGRNAPAPRDEDLMEEFERYR